MSILIVDDSEDMRLLFKTILKSAGYIAKPVKKKDLIELMNSFLKKGFE